MAEFRPVRLSPDADSTAVSGQDDRALARSVARSGDETAFRLLYRRHTPRLLAFARRIMNNESDAEDVVQETWVRAVRGFATFREQSELSTWLMGIVVHVARSALRRNGRWVDGVDPDLAAPSRPAMLSEAIDIERALALLPAGYRTVLLLHDHQGFTHVDIAQMLGVTAGTSKAQLFHARRAMRRLLEPPVEVSNDE